jgi:hypothetical protein
MLTISPRHYRHGAASGVTFADLGGNSRKKIPKA